MVMSPHVLGSEPLGNALLQRLQRQTANSVLPRRSREPRHGVGRDGAVCGTEGGSGPHLQPHQAVSSCPVNVQSPLQSVRHILDTVLHSLVSVDVPFLSIPKVEVT